MNEKTINISIVDQTGDTRETVGISRAIEIIREQVEAHGKWVYVDQKHFQGTFSDDEVEGLRDILNEAEDVTITGALVGGVYDPRRIRVQYLQTKSPLGEAQDGHIPQIVIHIDRTQNEMDEDADEDDGNFSCRIYSRDTKKAQQKVYACAEAIIAALAEATH